ncbi:MAG: hypothetical protein ACPGYP_04490 [Solirubrobacterales bacterium]
MEPLADMEPLVVEKKVFVERESTNETPESAAKAARTNKQRSPEAKPKAIIIGRGPTLMTRLARVAPSPSPVMAGASALLIALVGIALISPSGDNATAQRSTAAFIDDPGLESAGVTLDANQSTADDKAKGKSRDPFAADGYKAPQPTAQTGKSDRKGSKSRVEAKRRATANAKTRATAPAASTASHFSASLITYSSFTPWTKSSKRAGSWIDFGGEPTVKVIAVKNDAIELFVVTDVEVIEDKSRKIEYDNPIRQVKVGKGGIVRFADYRNIQGDDVTYTIRYSGSNKVVVKRKN